MRRPLAYISFNSTGNRKEVIEAAKQYCRMSYLAGYSPICPALFQMNFLSADKPIEYKDGREMANDLLRRARVLVVCGDAESKEELEDMAIARRYQIPILAFSDMVFILEKIVKGMKG